MNFPKNLSPGEIERESFALINQQLGELSLPPLDRSILMRVIHATADFDYKDNLFFSPGAAQTGLDALRQGHAIVTDTNMAKAGVNCTELAKLGGRVECYMAHPDVEAEAKRRSVTRATAAVDKASLLGEPVIFAVGNAPTALLRLYEHVKQGTLCPKLIIAVPVGFINVEESKELIATLDLPVIVAKGRKGGSSVAAAICNALIYAATGRQA